MPTWSVEPILRSANVADTVEYYTSVLGFECPNGVFQGVDTDEGGIYALLSRDGAGLHIQIRREERHTPSRERIASDAYFYVDDAEALEHEFRSKGATIHRPIARDNAYGLIDFVVEDPEGNRLVFGSPNGSPEGSPKPD